MSLSYILSKLHSLNYILSTAEAISKSLLTKVHLDDYLVKCYRLIFTLQRKHSQEIDRANEKRLCDSISDCCLLSKRTYRKKQTRRQKRGYVIPSQIVIYCMQAQIRRLCNSITDLLFIARKTSERNRDRKKAMRFYLRL